MIYHLFELLKDYDIPGQGLMHYLSFRAIAASITAMLLSLVAGSKIIKWLQKKQIGESIRELGLEGQMEKKGTPTMGGIIILISILIPVLLFANLTNIYIILLIISTLWLGLLGFADDYIKVFKKNKEGVNEKTKLIVQIVLGLGIALTVCFSDQIVIRESPTSHPEVNIAEGIEVKENETIEGGIAESIEKNINPDSVKSTKTTIPFVKHHEFDYKSLIPFEGKWADILKWIIYAAMIVIVITACSNGSNLTDGLDGLNTGISAIIGVTLGIFAYLSGNIINSDYLNIMYIPGSGEITIFMAAMVGALIGFLWYNSFPAQVFMGDTGSLAIGGIIGVSAILIRKELLIPILCGVFFVESLSVLMQRFYYKRTRKSSGTGKRILKMAPLHHHFQKEGIESIIKFPKRAIPESKIVLRFWIVGIILATITVALLKLR